MAKFLFTTVREKYDCPRCNAKAGAYCRMPSGRQANTPHSERVRLASKEDINDSRIPITTGNDLVKKIAEDVLLGKNVNIIGMFDN